MSAIDFIGHQCCEHRAKRMICDRADYDGCNRLKKGPLQRFVAFMTLVRFKLW
jgi:hypothetical protein